MTKKENTTKLRNQRFKERLENDPKSIERLMKVWDIESIEDMQKACRYMKEKDDIGLVIDHIHYSLPKRIVEGYETFIKYYDDFVNKINNVDDNEQAKLNVLIYIYNKSKNTEVKEPTFSKINKISILTRIHWAFKLIKELFNKLEITISKYNEDIESKYILSNDIIENIKVALIDIGVIENTTELFGE